MTNQPTKLLWLDLETTGLDSDEDSILEIGYGIADLSSPFSVTYFDPIVLHYKFLDTYPIHPIVKEMHKKNGLWDECAAMPPNDLDAFRKMQSDLKDDRFIVAGSSVHFDRSFMVENFETIVTRNFHHRHFDVTTLKLLCQSLGMPKSVEAESVHRSIPDIRQSVEDGFRCVQWLRGRQ